MPCPEKFKETLVSFNVDEDTVKLINTGFEEIVSKTPKKIKAEYFKRAADIMDERLDYNKKLEIFEYNACCKGGARDKASKAFAKENQDLSFDDKLARISNVANMGKPVRNDDKTITVHAIYYKEGEKFLCACPNFNKVKRNYSVSKTYCFCCGGHFKYHYEIMLNVKLRVKEVVSSPLDSDGKNPCVFTFEII